MSSHSHRTCEKHIHLGVDYLDGSQVRSVLPTRCSGLSNQFESPLPARILANRHTHIKKRELHWRPPCVYSSLNRIKVLAKFKYRF
jgi:hypothetical protein